METLKDKVKEILSQHSAWQLTDEEAVTKTVNALSELSSKELPSEEEIEKISKKEADYDRQLAVFGKEKADMVYFFCRKGLIKGLSLLPNREETKTHCVCDVNNTTGSTKIECCNNCGKPLEKENWYSPSVEETIKAVMAQNTSLTQQLEEAKNIFKQIKTGHITTSVFVAVDNFLKITK